MPLSKDRWTQLHRFLLETRLQGGCKSGWVLLGEVDRLAGFRYESDGMEFHCGGSNGDDGGLKMYSQVDFVTYKHESSRIFQIVSQRAF
jgi:hypothetical protein